MTDPAKPNPTGPNPSREERPLSREERLAAKLRENLRRRKAQSRSQAGAKPEDDREADPLGPTPRSSQNPVR